MQAQVRLISKRQETTDSTTFSFSRPDGFNYLAGQFMWLVIPHDQPDDRGTRRHFTIASSPTEPDLMVTTKFANPGSTFKQALRSLKDGTKIEIRGPHGEFTLPEDPQQPLVLLGGGIGITPFRAMVKFATDKGLPTPLTLIYANKIPADIVYHQEFDAWQAHNPNFKVVFTVDQAETSWTGETGHLTGEIIKKYIPDLEIPLYYICGPVGMIEAYQKILTGLDINPDQIHTEDFSGY